MSEKELNEQYIKNKIQGICQDCMWFDKTIPIINKMLSEAYISGFEQGKFDLKMDLQQKVEQLEQKDKEIDRLNKEYERIYNENCKLRENHNINDITLLDEIDRLNNIIDTMLEFSFFKEECPLNFGFGDEKEEKAQDVFYEDDYCEENCNDIYKKCWLKYFEKLQELKEE